MSRHGVQILIQTQTMRYLDSLPFYPFNDFRTISTINARETIGQGQL